MGHRECPPASPLQSCHAVVGLFRPASTAQTPAIWVSSENLVDPFLYELLGQRCPHTGQEIGRRAAGYTRGARCALRPGPRPLSTFLTRRSPIPVSLRWKNPAALSESKQRFPRTSRLSPFSMKRRQTSLLPKPKPKERVSNPRRARLQAPAEVGNWFGRYLEGFPPSSLCR